MLAIYIRWRSLWGLQHLNEPMKHLFYLINPAFCSALIRETILGYSHECKQNMPYVLTFLVLPLILHKRTRDLFPRAISTKFHSWVHSHQGIMIGFHERTSTLVPFSKEAIYWCLSSGLLESCEGGVLSAPKTKSSIQLPDNSESIHCVNKAHFLGRWFTRAGEPSTIYAILGIRPWVCKL